MLFRSFCGKNDWIPAFYQTLPDLLPLYEHLGFSTLKIGEEAVVDLKGFSTSGKAAQDLRSARNKLSKLGYRIEFHQPPLPSFLVEELRLVSDAWLRLMKGSEKRFSVGWFDETYLRESLLALVRAPDGSIGAFANVLSPAPAQSAAIDLMRGWVMVLMAVDHGSMFFNAGRVARDSAGTWVAGSPLPLDQIGRAHV